MGPGKAVIATFSHVPMTVLAMECARMGHVSAMVFGKVLIVPYAHASLIAAGMVYAVTSQSARVTKSQMFSILSTPFSRQPNQPLPALPAPPALASGATEAAHVDACLPMLPSSAVV